MLGSNLAHCSCSEFSVDSVGIALVLPGMRSVKVAELECNQNYKHCQEQTLTGCKYPSRHTCLCTKITPMIMNSYTGHSKYMTNN